MSSLPNSSESAPVEGSRETPAKRRRQTLFAAAAAALLVVSRVLARPKSFWEWDDYIFGLSLHLFAPQASVPQAPFFPAFVYLARFVRWIVRDDVSALTWVSVAASCASLLLVYVIVKDLFGSKRLAARSAVLLAFFPAAWFYAGIPISDAAGVAAALLAFWLAVRSWSRPGALSWAAASFGLACGVRLQSAAVALVPLVIGFARSRPGRRAAALAVGAGALALCFAGPVLLAARGWRPVVAMFGERLRYQVSSTSVFAVPASAPFLFDRWVVAPWVTAAYAFFVLFLTALGAGLLARPATRSVLVLLLASFGPCAIVAWIFLDPAFSGRYVLVYLPAQAILVAYGSRALERRLGLSRLPWVGAAAAVWGAVLVAPAIRVLHEEASPPEQAAAAIGKEAGGKRYAILHPHELYVHAELLFPGVRKVDLERAVGPSLRPTRDEALYRFGLLSLSDPSETACWPRLAPFATVGSGRYLEVPFGPVSRLAPAFGEGWFPEESEPGERCGRRLFRWMSSRGRVTLPAIAGDWDLEIELRVPLALLPGPPPAVSVSLNGAGLEDFVMREERLSKRIPAPRATSRADAENELVFGTSRTFVPARRGGTDTRELGLQLYRLTAVER